MLRGSEQPTSDSGANLVLDSGPVVVSITQVLMGKKRRHWLVLQASELHRPARSPHKVKFSGSLVGFHKHSTVREASV